MVPIYPRETATYLLLSFHRVGGGGREDADDGDGGDDETGDDRVQDEVGRPPLYDQVEGHLRRIDAVVDLGTGLETRRHEIPL